MIISVLQVYLFILIFKVKYIVLLRSVVWKMFDERFCIIYRIVTSQAFNFYIFGDQQPRKNYICIITSIKKKVE